MEIQKVINLENLYKNERTVRDEVCLIRMAPKLASGFSQAFATS